MTSPRRIAVVGAGPAGTALALGLVRQGYDVTLVSDRTAEEIRRRLGDVEPDHLRVGARGGERAGHRRRCCRPSPPIERMSYATVRARRLHRGVRHPARHRRPARSTSGSGCRC